jgi:hypothetical protein
VDYWITRKVYSPIVIPIKEIRVRPGKQRIEIPIHNRYDSTDLNQTRGYWKLMRDGKTIQSGKLILSAPPHRKTSTVVDLQLGRDLNRYDYLLELKFIDFRNLPINEHTIHLLGHGEEVNFTQRLTGTPSAPLQREDSTNITKYTIKDYRFDVNKTAGTVSISSPRSKKKLLEGPFLRVGRTPAMAEYRNYPRYNIKFWEPPLLTDAKLLDCRILTPTKDTAIVHLKLEYVRSNKGSQAQSIIADLHWTVSSQGWIDVDYELLPRNVEGCFLELGLAFQLPQETNELYWLGDGPFNSYPGQSYAARRGIWHVKPKSITDPYNRYYNGNRANVDVVAMTDRTGSGLGIIMDKAMISLEKHTNGMIFSHLLGVAGKGNKTGGMMTLLPVNADKIKSAQGTLRIMVLESDNWPDLFQTYFADERNKP